MCVKVSGVIGEGSDSFPIVEGLEAKKRGIRCAVYCKLLKLTKITNENSNTSVNSELINESKHPQSSSDHIRKNVQTGGEKKKRKISRKHDSSYLKFGFIQEPGNELDPRPLCIVCCASLSNDAMKPLKLEKYLQSKHPDLAKKPLEYFQRMHEGMKKQKT